MRANSATSDESFISSENSISCKSRSSGGRCATGRHVSRNPRAQKHFRESLLQRDRCCIATGETNVQNLIAAHLEKSFLIKREHLFSPVNGVLLKKELENMYDRHMWYFDENGVVHVLFKNWVYKDSIQRVLIDEGPQGPSAEMINIHNNIAQDIAKHHCPECWKLVGQQNILDHQCGSCEKIDANIKFCRLVLISMTISDILTRN